MRLAALAFLLLLVAAPARAARVSIHLLYEDDDREDLLLGDLDFVAGHGERNRVTARLVDGRYLITDHRARVRAGRRCRQHGRHSALCTIPERVDIGELRANLRDRNDRLDVSELPLDIAVSGGPGADRLRGGGALYGGPGDDVLRGGTLLDGGPGDDDMAGSRFSDSLYGGPGRDIVRGERGDDEFYGDDADSDRYIGGPGEDLISYEYRKRPVHVSLARGGGVEGEHDRFSGIENLTGGRGPDRLAGDAGNNYIVIQRGRVGAGAGDDTVDAEHRADVFCGPGNDGVQPLGGLSLLEPDCEQLSSATAAQPLDIDRRGVDLELACRRHAHAVTLVSARGRVVAKGTSDAHRGACLTRLTFTAAGRALPRPAVVAVRGVPYPWRFRLR